MLRVEAGTPPRVCVLLSRLWLSAHLLFVVRPHFRIFAGFAAAGGYHRRRGWSHGPAAETMIAAVGLGTPQQSTPWKLD